MRQLPEHKSKQEVLKLLHIGVTPCPARLQVLLSCVESRLSASHYNRQHDIIGCANFYCKNVLQYYDIYLFSWLC